jgi:N utilization substance protein A
MSASAEVLAAIRELSTTKQLDRNELLELLRDGIHAALVRRYGPNVRFELSFDELKGTIRIVRLRQVVEAVEDSSAQVSLEEAQYEDPEFAPGDMLEEDVPFAEFGRLAVQAAKQRSSSGCAKASAPGSAKSLPARSASCFRERSSRSSAASW